MWGLVNGCATQKSGANRLQGIACANFRLHYAKMGNIWKN